MQRCHMEDEGGKKRERHTGTQLALTMVLHKHMILSHPQKSFVKYDEVACVRATRVGPALIADNKPILALQEKTNGGVRQGCVGWELKKVAGRDDYTQTMMTRARSLCYVVVTEARRPKPTRGCTELGWAGGGTARPTDATAAPNMKAEEEHDFN